MMKFYHVTDAANEILAHGFKDGEGLYMTTELWRGVWFSDRPLDINEGAIGETLLELETDLKEEDLARYEWVQEEEGDPECVVPAEFVNPRLAYREWLVPAEFVNTRMRVCVIDEEWQEPTSENICKRRIGLVE